MKWLRKLLDRPRIRFLEWVFGRDTLVLIVRKDGRPGEGPSYEVNRIALVNPAGVRVDTFDLGQTYKLDYGDRLHLVVDIRVGREWE